jgi:DNA polymerase elongation subunit (family B)
MSDVDRIAELKARYEKNDSAIRALDIAQKGFKVCSNSLYGALGLAYFRYYDSILAEAITATGQVMLKTSMSSINQIMNKLSRTEGKEYVLAADTDSNYVLIEPIIDMLLKSKKLEKTQKNIVDVVEDFVMNGIQPILDKKFIALLAKMGGYEKRIYFKLENIGASFLCTKKKRNIFDIMYSEGVRYDEPKIKITGLEIVRSSTPKVVKEYLKEAVRICMRGNETELQEYVSKVKVLFMKHDYQEIAFPRGCNGMSVYASNSSIYQKGTPMHVRGSLLHNHHLKRLGLTDKYNVINEGEKIKYIALRMPNPIRENVFSFIGKIPEELGIIRYIDKETQYQKAFLEPLKSVLDVIGWEPEHRLTFD